MTIMTSLIGLAHSNKQKHIWNVPVIYIKSVFNPFGMAYTVVPYTIRERLGEHASKL